MTTNTKIAGGIAILVIVIVGGVYLYSNKAPVTSVTENQTTVAPAHLLQGTITGVNVDTLQITVQASTTSPVKTVTIRPATKIEKLISQKNAKGETEKQAIIEVDVGDIVKGSPVTVEYQSENSSVLDGVGKITFTVFGNVDAYFKQPPQSSANIYMKSKVVSIDVMDRILQYKPYTLATTGPAASVITLPSGIAVYRADDPLRLSILHTRVAATLMDVRPEQIIFLEVDPKTLHEGKVVPKALIILGK